MGKKHDTSDNVSINDIHRMYMKRIERWNTERARMNLKRRRFHRIIYVGWVSLACSIYMYTVFAMWNGKKYTIVKSTFDGQSEDQQTGQSKPST